MPNDSIAPVRVHDLLDEFSRGDHGDGPFVSAFVGFFVVVLFDWPLGVGGRVEEARDDELEIPRTSFAGVIGARDPGTSGDVGIGGSKDVGESLEWEKSAWGKRSAKD